MTFYFYLSNLLLLLLFEIRLVLLVIPLVVGNHPVAIELFILGSNLAVCVVIEYFECFLFHVALKLLDLFLYIFVPWVQIELLSHLQNSYFLV